MYVCVWCRYHALVQSAKLLYKAKRCDAPLPLPRSECDVMLTKLQSTWSTTLSSMTTFVKDNRYTTTPPMRAALAKLRAGFPLPDPVPGAGTVVFATACGNCNRYPLRTRFKCTDTECSGAYLCLECWMGHPRSHVLTVERTGDTEVEYLPPAPAAPVPASAAADSESDDDPLVDPNALYELKSIVKSKWVVGVRNFLCRWEGDYKDTWETKETLGCPVYSTHTHTYTHIYIYIYIYILLKQHQYLTTYVH